IYGLKHIAEHGLGWLPVMSIVVGLAIGIGFVRRQRVLADPLIDLRLFTVPAFSAALATYTLGATVAFGAFVFMAQYLQLVLGLSPLQAGLWMLPWSGAFIVSSMLTPLIPRRPKPVMVVAVGQGVAALGFIMISQVDRAGGLALLVAGAVIYSLGLGPVFTLANDVVLNNAPPERAGAAASISETGAEL